MDINDFWTYCGTGLLAWVVFTGLIYRAIRSDKTFTIQTVARKHVLLGLMLVVISIVPGAASWYAFNSYKNQQQMIAGTIAENLMNSWRTQCQADTVRNRDCSTPPDEEALIRDISEPTVDILAQVISLLTGLISLLGGALGINILTDGLLRRDKASTSGHLHNKMSITKTTTIEIDGKVFTQSTVLVFPSKS